MPAPRPGYRRLSDSARHRIEVATAMAWEALVDAHTAQALEFIALFEERLALEDALNRYLREMDLPDTMAAAVRTRVLVTIEDTGPDPLRPPVPLREGAEPGAAEDDEEEGWRRFRPDVVMRGVIERQRSKEEIVRLVELAIARAEEEVIKVHVDSAITFAALLEDSGALSRAVEQYISALNVVGGRGQAVLQRTMARLADVHLPKVR
ncbi:MAG: hypothetical protein ACT443_05490 [Gemmatimonadota bacterium]